MAAAKTVAIEPHHFKAISRNSHLLSVHRSLISKFRSFLFSLFFFNIRSYFILWSLRNKLVINPHVLSSLLTLPPQKKNKGGGKVVEIGPLFLDARRFFFHTSMQRPWTIELLVLSNVVSLTEFWAEMSWVDMCCVLRRVFTRTITLSA